MKKIYMLNNSNGVIGLFLGLKSRISTRKPLLTLVMILMLGAWSVPAWGIGYAKLQLYSSPNNGGYVYANDKNQNNIGTKTDDYATSGGVSAQTLYRFASAKAGYTFKGWSSSEDDNSGSTSSSVKVDVGSWGGTNTDTYYAIFARLTAQSTDALAFGTKLVGAEWSEGTTKSVTIDYVHAGNITATISGTNSTEFSLSSSSSLQNNTVVSGNTNSETNSTITVYFKPSTTGSKTAKLTISSNNGLTSIEINLTGTGQATVNPTFTNTIAASYYVNDSELNLASKWTSNNTSGEITYSIVSFTPDIANETGATEPSINTTTNKLSLGQAGSVIIQMRQAASTGYYEKTAKDTIRINKRSNALACSWESWSKDVNVETSTEVTFSTNNKNYSQYPIVIEQTSGDTEGNVIATYSSTNNQITSTYNLGTATWKLSQVGNYEYFAADTMTLTVNVKKGSSTCYILQDDAERSWATINSTTYGDGSAYLTDNGQRLQFQVKRSPITVVIDYSNNDHFDVKYSADGSKWTTLKKLNTLDNMNQWYDFDIDISGLTIKYIKFESETGAMGNRHVRNVRITRKKWYKLEDKDGNEISSLTMPTNTLGGNHTTAKFTVDYSTCADQIKVVSNHPHITVSPTSFASNGDGTKEITVTYACNDPEVIDGVITVYTPYENKTINVHATTEKKSQTIEWSELFAGETVSLPQTFTSDNAASATSHLPVKYNSGNPEIIEIAEDSLSFTIVGTGPTTLTATQAGNDEWKSVSDSKTINASNKKIQRIIWNQQFTRSLSVGNIIPLTAKVTVLNVAEGTETESPERTNEIVYSCQPNDTVIEIYGGTNIRVIGYGKTTITASVAGNEEYEAAASVTLPVRVREIQTGDCEMSLVFEQTSEIEFFQGNTNEIIGSAIAIDHANGIPDKLSFDVRGAAWKLGIEYYKGSIQVQQSTDNKLNWSGALATVSPAKGATASSGEIQLDPEATHIRFVRPDGGQGYHYVGSIQITRLPYIRTEKDTIKLGNVSVGETRDFTIPVSYCSVKGKMGVSKQYTDDVLTVEEEIDAECGDMDSYNVEASVMPTSVGPWSNTVTVRDQLSGMFVDVVITASIQKGSQWITWNPTQEILATEVPALNATASSGLAVSYAITSGNNTVARMDNGQVVIIQPGNFTITASQGGNTNYNAAPSVSIEFTVIAETLTLIEGPTAEDITYGQTLNASTLSSGSVEDSKGNPVAGTFSWESGTTKPDAGDAQEFAVVFNPSVNPAWYNVLNTTAFVDVNPAEPELSWLSAPTPLEYNATGTTYRATSTSNEGAISYSITSGNSYATIGANSGVLTIIEAGHTITVQATQAVSANYVAPEPITVNVVIKVAPVFVFNGDGGWDDPNNWENEPVGVDPDIIVTGTLVVDDTISVGSLTIDPTGGVTIVENGLLIVNEATPDQNSGYGDLRVAEDGELELNGELKVRHFTLDAKLAGKNNLEVKEAAASGQVENPLNLDINGEAYFQMTFDPKGKISFGWYDFVVPFPVNISDGIFREGDLENHLVSGVDFIVQEYSETRNANKQKAWSNFYGTMQPGRVYTIGFNYDPTFDQNVFVFKKASGTIGGPTEFATQYTEGSGDTDDFGWNGLGNGMLQHGYITGSYSKMQVYNHAENKYDVLTGKNPTFAIGTSFFVQVDHTTPTMTWNPADANDDHPLYAPKRETFEVEEFLLSMRGENQIDACDHLYISGSEEATEDYVIGHDLRKMGNPTEAKTAQMWATKNGKKLCDIETHMVNYGASSDLNFFAPQAGTFELTVEEMPEDATLYLTYNGRAIWVLSASPYMLDLNAGVTEGYGLRIEAQAPQVATGFENGGLFNNANDVRKVVIDNTIYIITPEGKMYDIVGKSVKY